MNGINWFLNYSRMNFYKKIQIFWFLVQIFFIKRFWKCSTIWFVHYILWLASIVQTLPRYNSQLIAKRKGLFLFLNQVDLKGITLKNINSPKIMRTLVLLSQMNSVPISKYSLLVLVGHKTDKFVSATLPNRVTTPYWLIWIICHQKKCRLSISSIDV